MRHRYPTGHVPKPTILLGLVRPYRVLVGVLLAVTLAGNALILVFPKIIAATIDAYGAGTFRLHPILEQCIALIAVSALLTIGQNVLQALIAERAARDIRAKLIDRLSRQTFSYIHATTPSRLLTNLTSDTDTIKNFFSMVIPMFIMSVFILTGASAFLISTNTRLAFQVLGVLPLVAFTFYFINKRVRRLFLRTQEILDRLNKTINESIIGAALVRVLNAQGEELDKFAAVNGEARDTGLAILRYMTLMIPTFAFAGGLASLVVLVSGGHAVIGGSMTLGQFAAFNSYIMLLIFPIIMLGIMSNIIVRTSASYGRIVEILDAPDPAGEGDRATPLTGRIDVDGITLTAAGKRILSDISFRIRPGTRTAIIGPTAAGKTQLLYVISGLIVPDTGTVRIDGIRLPEFNRAALYRQLGFVFQDSVLFNMTIRENIAFGGVSDEVALDRAIRTAELSEFLASLPAGQDTPVSERGTTLSGGQKQRIMLARALSQAPTVLLLDDFTARVDMTTEQRILANIKANYPDLTLVSVTQKIASVTDYDQIVVLMEGELVAVGTHAELMATCPEYVQMYESQKSTNAYEPLHP